MNNKAVADILDKFADVLEFKEETPFKINAYRRASRQILELSEDIETIWREGRLNSIPGVGKALAEKIGQFLQDGKINQLETELEDTPKDLFELLGIQNFGPKTAALAYKELGIGTLQDLRQAIDAGTLATLPGLGTKKVENIRKGLERREESMQRFSIGIAFPIAYQVIEYLKEQCVHKINRIDPAGSTRRFKETVHDIDILVETEHGEDVIKTFTQMPRVTQILGAGATKGSVVLDGRFQVDVRAVPPESYGAAQQYFTGSQAHNVRLRELAKKQGLKINEYGLYRGDEKIAGNDEAEIYQHLGMQWMPPELREDRGEIEAARDAAVPELITLDDIKADLHLHSTFSDGRNTLEEMVKAARARDYQYMAFCDHSPGALAGKEGIEGLKRQIQAVRALNEQYSDFEILIGSEIEIFNDGRLDLDDDVLQQLDFAVASVHGGFSIDATERTIAAMRNPLIDVIGHPTGRLISRRDPLPINIEQVVEAAVETGTALEINAMWDRLDLKDTHVKLAVDRGAKLIINTDSHDVDGLHQMMFGVGTARRGWARAKDVINTFTIKDFRAWQKRNR